MGTNAGTGEAGGLGGGFDVEIVGLLGLLVEVEAQQIFTLVTDGQVGEEKVAGRHGTVEVGHPGDEHTRQHREGGRGLRHPALSDGTSRLEGGEEEEVGLVGEGDVFEGILSGEDA